MTTARRLLVSIHDVTPYHLHRLEQLVPMVEEVVGQGKFALLVVPDFHREGRLDKDPAFAKRLRGWAEDGCEIFLHGFRHLDESAHVSFSAGLKAKRLTAGEGEFLGLNFNEADQKLIDGRKMVEDIIGRAVTGFVAPAWLYSPDSLRAIAHQGFTLCEDHFRVWNPQSQKVYARGPVVTYASRSPARLLSSLLWSRIATIALSRANIVRFAVHPGDVDAPELVAEISRALRAFNRSHIPSSYLALQSG
jgi:uncharacterized protein